MGNCFQKSRNILAEFAAFLPDFRGGPLPRFSPIQCEVSGTSQLEITFENSCNNAGWVEVLLDLQTRLLF